MTAAEKQRDLESLQDTIYREEVEAARALSVEERLHAVFELSENQFGMMLAGAMAQLGTQDEEEGWQEVRRWMQRLDQFHEKGLYVTEKPESRVAG